MGRRIIVAGAGAAGMMAAISAARSGAEVTVLEAMDRPGRKLLLTGNGRCNLTNMEPELPEHYYGTGRKLAKEVTGQFGAVDTRRFFAELGLLTSEKNGYVYPYTGQAAAVLEVLLLELRRLHVKLKLSERIIAISKKDGIWQVKTATWRYQADALILACGSKALPATGSDGSGYELAKMLGHTVIPPSPALAPVNCRGDFFAKLAGVRCRAAVSLYKKEKKGGRTLLCKETGELQWTKYGVSGIVVFQVSRFLSLGPDNQNLFLCVDLLPEFEREWLIAEIMRRAEALGEEKVPALLAGMLHEKLIPVILARSGISAKLACGGLQLSQAEAMVAAAREFELAVTGTKSFDSCQVCAGGVDCREVSGRNMESRKHPGLFFAGELLDVDGPCGGYNLQWAWSSGYAAGGAAAQLSGKPCHTEV